LLALIGSHYYLSRRFITVRLPVAAMQARKP